MGNTSVVGIFGKIAVDHTEIFSACKMEQSAAFRASSRHWLIVYADCDIVTDTRRNVNVIFSETIASALISTRLQPIVANLFLTSNTSAVRAKYSHDPTRKFRYHIKSNNSSIVAVRELRQCFSETYLKDFKWVIHERLTVCTAWSSANSFRPSVKLNIFADF